MRLGALMTPSAAATTTSNEWACLVLQSLLRIAKGDQDLVNDALVQACQGHQTLDHVVAYIESRGAANDPCASQHQNGCGALA